MFGISVSVQWGQGGLLCGVGARLRFGIVTLGWPKSLFGFLHELALVALSCL